MLNQPPSLLLFKGSLHKASIGVAAAASMLIVSWPQPAEALSLGRSRGAALLGRSLDMSVLASLETKEETPAATCFSAEVFYGDTRISEQNVSITTARSSPTELALRVRASNLIDEPFVTVYLRAACGQGVARKYVLLADSPSETLQAPMAPDTANSAAVAAPSSLANGAAAPSFGADVAAKRKAQLERRAALRASAGAAPPANAAAAALDQEQRAAARLAKAQAKIQASAQTRTAVQERKSKALTSPLAAPALASRPRLKVDLLDFTAAAEPRLRASSELLSQPTTDPIARAQAAAMWRTINSSPEDLLRDGDSLKAIETDVRAMSELTRQQSKELTTLRTDLRQAQTDRYANPVVYALGFLSLASMGIALLLWRRRSVSGQRAPWWGSVSRQDDDAQVSLARRRARSAVAQDRSLVGEEVDFKSSLDSLDFARSVAPMPQNQSYAAPPAPFVSSRSAKQKSNSYFGESSAHRTSELIPGASNSVQPAYAPDFGTTTPGNQRPVNAEELFDIQQQADFFMSLGQHSQAIDILQNHISDNVGTSALAYLDLFDIYHKIDQREDFDALRNEFNRVFNAQVPEFENYGSSSRGLEDYEPALQRIQALWPNPKVLAVIEESIFRMPELDAQPFDLEAYRELMLLYAVAKELSSHDSVNAELHIDLDIAPDLGLQEDFSGLSAPPTGVAPEPLQTKFSPTAVVPLTGAFRPAVAHEPLDFDYALENPIAEDFWDAAVSAPELDLDLDIDLGFSPDATQPIGKLPIAPATDPMANTINFEKIERADFASSKNAKR